MDGLHPMGLICAGLIALGKVHKITLLLLTRV